ncbi:hypothetical protein JZ751_021069 [Albula glossodonta]|uniref:Carboxylic ester hydrolase n=1 Tax=Albula glossodonta TaxID=121402 RepID=A0A8T2PJF7_9TELE|nr:hypothetical protein JZ751_021069 [Albula glossodonta]
MALVRSILLAVGMVTAYFGMAASDMGPVVSIKKGSLQGEIVRAKGTEQEVQRFLGIPFARPPVGDLRLAAPQPPLPWEGVLNATRQPNMCLQDPDVLEATSIALSINYSQPALSEDCLYLNVYAPSNLTVEQKAPVMVWIHGGGLVMGGAAQYDGTALAAYQGVVVVIIQYRLGVLGYFSTGDEYAAGNWGFLDQIAALQWVQENIKHFGGDPNSVTIFGESAGGISTSILTLSPLSSGLFHKAIFQSGVALVGKYSNNDALSSAKVMANVTGCDHSTTKQMVQCMKEKTSEDIINATKRMMIFLGATVDGVFLKKPGEDVLKSKDFLKVPVLLGTTNHEFGWILPNTFLQGTQWEKGVDKEMVISKMNLFFPDLDMSEKDRIAQEYLKDAKTPEAVRDGFTDMMGDLFMVIPTIKVAGYHRDAGAPVYLYEFRYASGAYMNRPSFVKADHADDVGFVFGACFWDSPISKVDEKLSPNGEGLVHWPVYGESEEYLKLDVEQTVGQKLKQDRVNLIIGNHS